MLYVRTWPIPKKLKTPDALIIKIDKNHRLYPPDELMADLDMRLNNPNDPRIPSGQKYGWAEGKEAAIDFTTLYWHDNARRFMRDDPNRPWWEQNVPILDDIITQIKQDKDVIIAVCENKPYHRSWRRILCQYLIGDIDTWRKNPKLKAQIDNWPINTVILKDGLKWHIIDSCHLPYTVTPEEVEATLKASPGPYKPKYKIVGGIYVKTEPEQPATRPIDQQPKRKNKKRKPRNRKKTISTEA